MYSNAHTHTHTSTQKVYGIRPIWAKQSKRLILLKEPEFLRASRRHARLQERAWKDSPTQVAHVSITQLQEYVYTCLYSYIARHTVFIQTFVRQRSLQTA